MRNPVSCRINLRYLLFCVFALLVFCSISVEAHAQPAQPLQLSLSEAILLAVRENPNVQQSELNHVEQKFALYVQHWQFKPHYSFDMSRTVASSTRNRITETSHTTFVQPQATLQTAVGTQLTLTSINNISDHYNPGLSLAVMQPLMRGFGRPIVEAALNNAIDSEKISRLNIDGTLRTTVTGVILAYLQAVSAEHTVENDKKALARAELSVKQTQLFIQAGHKAGNEIVTVQADVASAQTTLENDKNALSQARYALLAAIGLDPNTNVIFSSIDIPTLIKRYPIPQLREAQERTLENDIQYQTDQITYEGATKRALMQAEDNARPRLDLTLKTGVGEGSGGGRSAGIESLLNSVNKTQSIELSLHVPIDDQMAKQSIVSAKIALQDAELALKQEKWTKETNAITGWNNIASAERALHFAENAALLQQKTYDVSYKKYLYGLIDSTVLQSVQQQLVSADQALVNARIAYLTALVNIDLLMGSTLDTWHVSVRYG